LVKGGKMKKFKITLLSLVALTGVMTTAVAMPQYAGASAKSEIQSGVNSVNNGSNTNLSGLIRTVVNILLFILGAVAVIMIVVGGIRYTTSAGDSGSLKAARDTILYSVVGLVVALLAYAIVNFVLNSFS